MRYRKQSCCQWRSVFRRNRGNSSAENPQCACVKEHCRSSKWKRASSKATTANCARNSRDDFSTRNHGEYLLHEFGGGFQMIEFVGGQFRYVGNMAVIGCHTTTASDRRRYHFEPALVLQRYIEEQFVVAVCPMTLDRSHLRLGSLDLDISITKYNVAENWLAGSHNITQAKIWDDLQIEIYALVMITIVKDGGQFASSYLIPTVNSENFTFRYVNDGPSSGVTWDEFLANSSTCIQR